MKKNRLASLVFGCLLFSCGGPFPGVGENSLLEQANRVETESKVSSQIPFTYQLVKLLETFQGGILAENYAFLKISLEDYQKMTVEEKQQLLRDTMIVLSDTIKVLNQKKGEKLKIYSENQKLIKKNEELENEIKQLKGGDENSIMISKEEFDAKNQEIEQLKQKITENEKELSEQSEQLEQSKQELLKKDEEINTLSSAKEGGDAKNQEIEQLKQKIAEDEKKLSDQSEELKQLKQELSEQEKENRILTEANRNLQEQIGETEDAYRKKNI